MEKKINKTRHDLLYTVQRNLYKIIEWKVSLPRNTLVDKLVRRNDEGVRTSIKRLLNAITYTRITYTIRNAMFPPTFAFLSAMLIRSRDHRQSIFRFYSTGWTNLVVRWIEGSWNSCLEKGGTRINESLMVLTCALSALSRTEWGLDVYREVRPFIKSFCYDRNLLSRFGIRVFSLSFYF